MIAGDAMGDECNALHHLPALLLGAPGGGAQDGEPVDAVRMPCGQRDRDHPAERMASDMCAGNAEVLQQRHGVVGEEVERIWTGDLAAQPVAAEIVAHYLEISR